MTTTSKVTAEGDARPTVSIVYDGECPFCGAFVRMTRLRAASGPVALIDARTDHPLVRESVRRGYDLNRGMVVVIDGLFHHGSQAMNRLALLTTPSDLFNRAVRLLFAVPRVSRAVYPILVAGRWLTLKLLGRSPLRLPKKPEEDGEHTGRFSRTPSVRNEKTDTAE